MKIITKEEAESLLLDELAAFDSRHLWGDDDGIHAGAIAMVEAHALEIARLMYAGAVSGRVDAARRAVADLCGASDALGDNARFFAGCKVCNAAARVGDFLAVRYDIGRVCFA